MSLPRMRTAKTAAEELRKMDPDTIFRENHIRYLMNSGKIPVLCSGRRKFVNLDQLIDLLSRRDVTELSEKNTTPRVGVNRRSD